MLFRAVRRRLFGHGFGHRRSLRVYFVDYRIDAIRGRVVGSAVLFLPPPATQ